MRASGLLALLDERAVDGLELNMGDGQERREEGPVSSLSSHRTSGAP